MRKIILRLFLLLIFLIFSNLCVVYSKDNDSVDNDASLKPVTQQEPKPEVMKGIFNEALIVEEAQNESLNIFLVDDFETPSKFNKLKGLTNVYQMAPSRVMMSTVEDLRDGNKTNVLKLKFRRALQGGPYDQGGWCGYYSIIKQMPSAQPKYFSAEKYTYLTFYVKGETGSENFVVGLADRHWEKSGDAVKSSEVTNFLPEKKITSQWQKARVPLTEFLLDINNLASLSICFEKDCFPQGETEGYVYIDDIAFE